MVRMRVEAEATTVKPGETPPVHCADLPEPGQFFVNDFVQFSYALQRNGVRRLTPEEEIELAKRYERGDVDAKDSMIVSTLGLAVSIARRRQGQSRAYDMGDLVGETVVGAIRGVEKYDYRRGYRLSTYITRWMQSEVGRALEKHGTAVALPIEQRKKRKRIDKAAQQLEQELGRTPTAQEIADAAGETSREIGILHAPEDIASFEDTVEVPKSPVSMRLGEVLEDWQKEPASVVEREELTVLLERAINSLPFPQKRIAEEYTLQGEMDAALKRKLARELGVTQQQILALHEEALDMLANNPILSDYRQSC